MKFSNEEQIIKKEWPSQYRAGWTEILAVFSSKLGCQFTVSLVRRKTASYWRSCCQDCANIALLQVPMDAAGYAV